MNNETRQSKATLISAVAMTTVPWMVLGMTGCSSFKSILGIGPVTSHTYGPTPTNAQDVESPLKSSPEKTQSNAVQALEGDHTAKFASIPDAHAMMPASAMDDPDSDKPAPNINIFGELDGVQRASSKAVGSITGLQQLTYVSDGYDGDVAVDPTGKFIVFSSTRHSEHPQIYLQRIDGQSVTQLTFEDSADNANPTISPDGKSIAFCSTRAGTWDIYTMDVDGKNVVQATSGPTHDMHPSFAPDGHRLVYSSIGGRSNSWELWTIDLSTNQRRMIGFGLFPCWSPDRTRDRIAFQRARQRGSRWFSLWTLDLMDGEARNMTEVAVSTNAAIVSPTWSPDARQIAFATIIEPARADRKGNPAGKEDIWTVNADGNNRHRVTDGNGTNASPCWANDGRVYFVSDRGGTDCIWSSPVESQRSFMAKEKMTGAGAVGQAETAETH